MGFLFYTAKAIESCNHVYIKLSSLDGLPALRGVEHRTILNDIPLVGNEKATSLMSLNVFDSLNCGR